MAGATDRAGERLRVVSLVYGLWRCSGRVCHEHKSGHLSGRFGECIIENQRIVAALVQRHAVGALGDLVGLAFSHPLNRLQASAAQFVNHGGGFGRGFDTVRIGRAGRSGSARLAGLAEVFEDAKVERFLVRLQAPGDGVVALDADPSNEVGLITAISQQVLFLFFLVQAKLGRIKVQAVSW